MRKNKTSLTRCAPPISPFRAFKKGYKEAPFYGMEGITYLDILRDTKLENNYAIGLAVGRFDLDLLGTYDDNLISDTFEEFKNIERSEIGEYLSTRSYGSCPS